MRRKTWKRKQHSRGLLFTILTDVLTNLLAFYMLLAGVKSVELEKTQDIAAQVPGLKREVSGLQGDLKDARKDLTQANETGAKYRAIISDKETEIDNLGKVLHGVQSENVRLKGAVEDLGNEVSQIKKHFRAGSPVTLVLLIDLTNSMSVMIPELAETMATVFENLPQHSADFRLSVLGFRQGVVAEFPITKIEPYYIDNGKSQQAALAFIESLSVEGANTEHFSVFFKAVSSLQAAHPDRDPTRKERIIFLGDVGCSELDGQIGYSSGHGVDERAANAKIVDAMRRWAAWGDHAIVSLYLKSEHTKRDPGAAESEAWFKKLGSINPQSAFHTESSRLLRAVLKTARE